jgi:hypothetical protein
MVPDRNGTRPRGDDIAPPLALAGALVALDSLNDGDLSGEPLVTPGHGNVFLVILDEFFIQFPRRRSLVFTENQHHPLAVRREKKGE